MAADDEVQEILAGTVLETEAPSLREFSRQLRLPAGPLRGHYYDPDSDPCQTYLINEIDSGRWDRIFICAPPQLGGKTQCAILTPALRAAICQELPVGYGLPTLEALDKAWMEKLKPAVKGAGFEQYLPTRGPGARGGRGPTLTFQDPETERDLGRLVFLAGGAYGSTVAVVVVDEIDQLRTASGDPRWSDLEDMWHRADSYGSDAIRIGTGTVECDDPDKTIILHLVYEQGTGTSPWLMCPHCGTHQLVDGEQLRYDPADEETVRETAAIYCIHCGDGWSEDDRHIALRNMLMVHQGQEVKDGKIIGPEPRKRSLGLVWNAYASTLANISELAVERWAAEQRLYPSDPTRLSSHELMRKYIRYRECRLYTGDLQQDESDTEEISVRRLAKRSLSGWDETHRDKDDDSGIWSRHRTSIPDEAEACLRAIDIQNDRAYWVLQAYDSELRTWDVAWGYEYASAARQPFGPGELSIVLSRIDEVTNELAGELPIHDGWSAVDTGFRTDDIAKWLTDHHDWRGIRGVRHLPKALRARAADFIAYDPKWRPGLGRFEVRTDDARQAVHDALLIAPGQPGASHLPRGLSAGHHYIRHLCSWLYEEGKRSPGRKWVQKQKRDDWLDCKLYGYALLIYHTQKPKRKRRRPRKYGKLS